MFYWMLSGITATADGMSVYAAEVGNNRIQRFDRQMDGSYVWAATPVGNDPAIDEDPRTGWCGEDVRIGRLSAPYDVGVDGAGRLYVLNTSCLQVKVFDAGGAALGMATVTNNNGGYVHGIAVDKAGRAYLPEVGTILYPTGTRPTAPTGPMRISAGYTGTATVKASNGTAWVYAYRWTVAGWAGQWWPAGRTAWVQPWTQGWMWVWYGGSWYAIRYTEFVA
jgi:hypothetical protein